MHVIKSRFTTNCGCKFTLFKNNFNIKKGKSVLPFFLHRKRHVDMTRILKILHVILRFEGNKNIFNIMSVKNWFKTLRLPHFINSNIPLDETTDICVSQLFENTDTVEGFTKLELKRLLYLATKESYFILMRLLYKIFSYLFGLDKSPFKINCRKCGYPENFMVSVLVSF